MALTVELELGESLVLEEYFLASSKSEPFAIAISDRAIYLPAKRFWTLSTDPWYYRRVPLSEVRGVSAAPLRSAGLLVVALVMVVGGAALIFGMYDPLFRSGGGKLSGWPFALVVGGLALPFGLRGRRGLRVSTTAGTFQWKPPIVFDTASKVRIGELLDSVLDGARRVGLYTSTSAA